MTEREKSLGIERACGSIIKKHQIIDKNGKENIWISKTEMKKQSFLKAIHKACNKEGVSAKTVLRIVSWVR